MKNNISFIVPAFNCQNTIIESIDSVLDNNFEKGDEIIIVNDCSTDDTARKLLKYSKNKSIKIINHDRNRGGGAARNTAVYNANNNLIFCLDSDNILEKGSIKLLKKFLIDNNLDIACFGAVHFFKNGERLVTHKWKFKMTDYSLNDIFRSYIFPGASGNYLYTKESWVKTGGYPEFSGALDAWGFGFKQLVCNFKMRAMNSLFYMHRYGTDSYWVRESKKGSLSLRAMQIIIPYIDKMDRNLVNYLMSTQNRLDWFDNIGKTRSEIIKSRIVKFVTKIISK